MCLSDMSTSIAAQCEVRCMVIRTSLQVKMCMYSGDRLTHEMLIGRKGGMERAREREKEREEGRGRRPTVNNYPIK